MFSGAPFSGAPFSGVPRIFVASFITTSPLVGGGGRIGFTLVRRLTASPAVAGGGQINSPAQRRLQAAPAVAGGGALLATLVPAGVSRANSDRRTRGGGGGTRLRFPTFDSAAERTRGGG